MDIMVFLILLVTILAQAVLQTPLVAGASVGAFGLALWLRRSGDAIAVRRPENKPRLKKWLIAYAGVCALAGTALFVLFYRAANPGPGVSSVASPLYASVTVLHGGFFFGYMGWTGSKKSRLAYWLFGGVVVLLFALLCLFALPIMNGPVNPSGLFG